MQTDTLSTFYRQTEALSHQLVSARVSLLWSLPAALQSVFPQAELCTFLTLSKKDKERQLKELTMIVTGIRLFNRDCGKGGEGIDDCECVFMLLLKVLHV